MHELSVTQNIIKICSEEAEKNNVAKVKEIRIIVGELTGLIPACIQSYFDIASVGTKVEGAVLDIKKIPITVKCNECSTITEITERKYCCSNCNSYNVKIIKGNEFLIDSLEVE